MLFTSIVFSSSSSSSKLKLQSCREQQAIFLQYWLLPQTPASRYQSNVAAADSTLLCHVPCQAGCCLDYLGLAPNRISRDHSHWSCSSLSECAISARLQQPSVTPTPTCLVEREIRLLKMELQRSLTWVLLMYSISQAVTVGAVSGGAFRDLSESSATASRLPTDIVSGG